MPKIFKITVIFSLLLIFAIPSSAEFYQYVDSKGITHFTDNLSTIPARFQSQVERPHETIFITEKLTYPEYEKSQPAGIKLKTPEITKLRTKKNILLDQKKSLDQKFEGLIAEKQQMEKSRGNMKNAESVANYNKRVREINEKIKQYKKEEKRFKVKIDKFNQSINILETEIKNK